MRHDISLGELSATLGRERLRNPLCDQPSDQRDAVGRSASADRSWTAPTERPAVRRSDVERQSWRGPPVGRSSIVPSFEREPSEGEHRQIDTGDREVNEDQEVPCARTSSARPAPDVPDNERNGDSDRDEVEHRLCPRVEPRRDHGGIMPDADQHGSCACCIGTPGRGSGSTEPGGSAYVEL